MKVLKLLLLFAMGASLSLAGCDDDYLYPVEYPVYDPDGGSDNGGGDEIPVPEKVNNKVVAHRGGSAEAGTAKYPDNSIASLSYATVWGVTPSECDIYWTADNNVVVAHAANRLLCEQPQAVGTHARRTACRGQALQRRAAADVGRSLSTWRSMPERRGSGST